MTQLLKGKTALVTGSSSGIGLGIATSLAKQSCNIILQGIESREVLEPIAQELHSMSDAKVLAISCDLSEQVQIHKACEDILLHSDGVDILVNNAGMQFVAPIEEFPAEKWQKLLDVNLSAPFYLTQAFLPFMRKKGWGRILNIASVHGLVASQHKSAYVATKHALVGLTKVIALETANSGVTCNAICPGWVLTPLVEAQIQNKAKEKNISFEAAKNQLLGEKQPQTSFVTVEQLGELATFLCGNAASNMTGSTLTMDGGWTAQ